MVKLQFAVLLLATAYAVDDAASTFLSRDRSKVADSRGMKLRNQEQIILREDPQQSTSGAQERLLDRELELKQQEDREKALEGDLAAKTALAERKSHELDEEGDKLLRLRAQYHQQETDLDENEHNKERHLQAELNVVKAKDAEAREEVRVEKSKLDDALLMDELRAEAEKARFKMPDVIPKVYNTAEKREISPERQNQTADADSDIRVLLPSDRTTAKKTEVNDTIKRFRSANSKTVVGKGCSGKRQIGDGEETERRTSLSSASCVPAGSEAE